MLGKWLLVIVPVLIAAFVPSATADRVSKPGDAPPPVQLALSDSPAARTSLAGPVLSSSGAQVDATSAVAAAAVRSSVAATSAEGRPGGGFPPPGAAGPEPPGWAMLLCALVILGFMAVRRSRRD